MTTPVCNAIDLLREIIRLCETYPDAKYQAPDGKHYCSYTSGTLTGGPPGSCGCMVGIALINLSPDPVVTIQDLQEHELEIRKGLPEAYTQQGLTGDDLDLDELAQGDEVGHQLAAMQFVTPFLVPSGEDEEVDESALSVIAEFQMAQDNGKTWREAHIWASSQCDDSYLRQEVGL